MWHHTQMPWNIKSSNQMKMDFINKVMQKEKTMSEACRQFEISRKTGYKWLKRYEKEGADGFCWV